MTPRTPRLLLALSCAVVAASNGCGHYRPALFADRPLVTEIHDDKPIAVPARRSYDEREQISDIYLRRPLFDVVRPLDFPTGGDVNAMDEVPPSSWYGHALAATGEVREVAAVPPTLPVFALDERAATNDDALVVRDARGVRYELLADPPGKLGLLTGAEVVGGHLLRGLGLRAPRAWIASVPDSALVSDGPKSAERLASWLKKRETSAAGAGRVSATLWPDGIDVGVSRDYGTRGDDPNDTVDHQDRRTLRAMKIFAHWMGWATFSVRSARDVYVGKAGEGHLLHYVLGTSRAFGTQDLLEEPARDETGGGIGWNLVTFGLSVPDITPARRSAFPSVGYLPATLEPGKFTVSLPYSPFVRLTPADEYWAGKRLVDAGDEGLRAGIAAAELPEEAGRHLAAIMTSRRKLLVAHAMSVVSAIDVTATTGRAVWLRDRAIAAEMVETGETEYEIRYLDAEGVDQAPRRRLSARGELTVVGLPNSVLFGRVVIQVRTIRSGVPAPRACDIHVMADRVSARVIGVRH